MSEKIEHIFNAVKPNLKENRISNVFINRQNYTIKYIEDIINNNIQNETFDENQTDKNHAIFYHGLIKGSESIISKFDDDNLEYIFSKIGENPILISGDFWGIQSFIFDGLSFKKATKVIRSKSALVQIINFVISKIIEDKFDGYTILIGAGKFTILAKNSNSFRDKLKEIQTELDNYFFKNHFGRSGYTLSAVEADIKTLINDNNKPETIKSLFDRLATENELGKYKKFDLSSRNNFLNNSFKVEHQEICEICHLRIATKVLKNEKKAGVIERTQICEICDSYIELGTKLTNSEYIRIFKSNKLSNDSIEILNFANESYFIELYQNFKIFEKNITETDLGVFNILENSPQHINQKHLEQIPKLQYWSLSSRIPMKYDEQHGFKIPKTFDDILDNSSGLMALKADVDTIGDTFREFLQDEQTPFKKFIRLSREMDLFFSDYVSDLINKNDDYREKIYVVFTGGDDVFVLGEWNTVVQFAKDLREKFYKFSNNTTTISMGLVMFKSGTLKEISELVDEAEKRAKGVKDSKGNTRNGIDIFETSMKFDQFIDIENQLKVILDQIYNIKDNGLISKDSSAFLYRLMSFAKMSQQSQEFVNKETSDEPRLYENFLWKSKLTNSFRRNISNKHDDILKNLSELIGQHGSKIIPSIMMSIYRKRDKNQK